MEQPSVAPSEPPTAPSTAEPEVAPLARVQSGPALPTEPVMAKKGAKRCRAEGVTSGIFHEKWHSSRDSRAYIPTYGGL